MSEQTLQRPVVGADAAPAPAWTRLLLVWAGVPQSVVGLWAVLAPRHWYDTFPGFGPLLAAAEPPFNAHLISDTGCGFLATGLMALAAAAWGARPAVVIAAAGLAVHALPHLVYHAMNPAPTLGTVTNVANVVVLTLALALPIAAVVGARPQVRR